MRTGNRYIIYAHNSNSIEVLKVETNKRRAKKELKEWRNKYRSVRALKRYLSDAPNVYILVVEKGNDVKNALKAI